MAESFNEIIATRRRPGDKQGRAVCWSEPERPSTPNALFNRRTCVRNQRGAASTLLGEQWTEQNAGRIMADQARLLTARGMIATPTSMRVDAASEPSADDRAPSVMRLSASLNAMLPEHATTGYREPNFRANPIE